MVDPSISIYREGLFDGFSAPVARDPDMPTESLLPMAWYPNGTCPRPLRPMSGNPLIAASLPGPMSPNPDMSCARRCTDNLNSRRRWLFHHIDSGACIARRCEQKNSHDKNRKYRSAFHDFLLSHHPQAHHALLQNSCHCRSRLLETAAAAMV